MSSVMKVDSITKSDGTAGVHIEGHVINVTTASYNTGASYSANTSYVNTATLGTVTTKLANSKIMIVTDVPIQTQKQNTIWSVALRSSIDSYASNLVIKHFVRYSTNDHTTGFTGMTYLHDANQSAGTSITYRYYVKANNSSGGGWYCIDQWGVSNASGYAFTTNMLEIAQ